MLSMVHVSLRKFTDKFNIPLNLDEYNEMKEIAQSKTNVSHEWNPDEYHLPTVWC